jgi:hypothetical protein
MPKATPTMNAQFEAFVSKEKFPAEPGAYTGVSDPMLKAGLAEKINLAANDFMRVAEGEKPDSKAYVNAIETGLGRFLEYTQLDTEERERICMYFEELMDIVGLESSEGQLNTFMYGFDPGK